MAQKFHMANVAHPKVAPLLSDDHFTVDGTLVQAWASLKSFVPKEAPPPSDRAPPPDAGGAPDQPPQAETTADTEQKAESTAMPNPATETPRSRNEEVRGLRVADREKQTVGLWDVVNMGHSLAAPGRLSSPTPRRRDGAREDQPPSGPETAS